jgi:asparagine synthase (glutamine-hydrolysing)
MFRFRGLIEFSELQAPAHAIEVTSDAAWDRVTLPGVDLAWDPRHASVALEDGILALASGRARFGSVPAGSEAARWIALYHRHGAHAAAEVGGGFAVAVIDFGKRQALLLVDRFSMEAMCYRALGDTLAFSDSCNGIAGVSGEIDAQSIHDYLYFHVIPSPATAFADLRRVEPAHVVVADRESARSEAYWTPVFHEHDSHNLSDRMRGFVDAVRDSVALEADDARTACFLSGGTDSSTISGMLTACATSRPTRTRSASRPRGTTRWSTRALQRAISALRITFITSPRTISSLRYRKVAASLDQPFGNSSLLPAYFCALRAREDGFTRMLAGDGGDELFGGNSRYATQKLFEPYHALPRWVRQAVLEGPATRWSLFREVPGFRQVGGYVRHARVPMPDRLETFNLLHRLGRADILTPEILARVEAERPAARQRSTWQATDGASLVNRMLAYDWKYTLADSDLPKVRAAAQLAGVTVGYPFLSRELTDLSLGLPPGWKVNGTKLRWFFKRALRDVLPSEILTKKKHGFGLPFGAWCLRHPALRKLAEDSLEGIVARNMIRGEFARDLLVKRLPEAPGYYGEMVWILMMLEQWMRSRPPVVRPPYDGPPALPCRTGRNGVRSRTAFRCARPDLRHTSQPQCRLRSPGHAVSWARKRWPISCDRCAAGCRKVWRPRTPASSRRTESLPFAAPLSGGTAIASVLRVGMATVTTMGTTRRTSLRVSGNSCWDLRQLPARLRSPTLLASGCRTARPRSTPTITWSRSTTTSCRA